MLYDKETLILKEVTSTLLFNEIRKKTKSRGAGRVWFGGYGKKEKSRLVEGMSLLSQERSLKE